MPIAFSQAMRLAKLVALCAASVQWGLCLGSGVPYLPYAPRRFAKRAAIWHKWTAMAHLGHHMCPVDAGSNIWTCCWGQTLDHTRYIMHAQSASLHASSTSDMEHSLLQVPKCKSYVCSIPALLSYTITTTEQHHHERTPQLVVPC